MDGSSLAENHRFILPCYATPRFPHWCSLRRIILLGDAAHALPGGLGQGAAFAIEDALAIALLLKYYHLSQQNKAGETLKLVAKSYEEVRMARVRIMLDSTELAKHIRDPGKPKTWWQEWVQNRFFGLFVRSCCVTGFVASFY